MALEIYPSMMHIIKTAISVATKTYILLHSSFLVRFYCNVCTDLNIF